MYKDDVKDLYRQKREAKKAILIDFFEIYLKMRLFFPQLEEERIALINLVQMYFDAERNENEVLRAMKKQYGKLDEHEGVDDLLDDFDDMFEKLYDYCQDVFVDYDEFLGMYGDFFDLLVFKIRALVTGAEDEQISRYRHRLKMRKLDFQVFDDEYREKVLVMLPNLKEVGDDFDGEA